MKLAILMDLNSPWSTQAALQLANCVREAHVITIKTNLYDNCGGFADPVGNALSDVARSVNTLKAPFRTKLSYPILARQLGNILKSCDVDVLLTLAGGWYGALAYLSGFRPYVVYIVGSDVLLSRGLKRVATSRVLRAAARTFVNGMILAHKTQDLCPRARVEPLYLGIDTQRFAPGDRSHKEVRVVCTRRFEPVYNNEYLIDGLARFSSCRAEVITTFASFGELLPKTKNYAQQQLSAEMLARTHFLGGVGLDTLVKQLAEADIYVSLARSDGTSTSLLEAMACGAYPILSDIPQNREWVDEAKNNGMLVPLDQPDMLADALRKAIEDPELRVRSAQYNRQLVLEKANSSRNMGVLSQALAGIVTNAA